MTLSEPEIVKFLDSLEEESKAIKEEILKMCWFMRGGLTYDESMLLTYSEREIINKIVTDNLETTKKSGMPFY